jgi:hypothetical protein
MLAKRFVLSLAFVAAFAFPRVAAAQPTPAAEAAEVHLRGTIREVRADVLTLQSPSGDQTVTLRPNVRVQTVERASLADLKPGAYVGVASRMLPDGTEQAVGVQIFPSAQRGPAAGSKSWDLAGASTMTNATVEEATGSVAGVDNRVLTLTYQGGQKKIAVPATTPIVRAMPGDASLLVPGASVFVFATRDSSGYVARVVIVGKGGAAPPM